MRSDIDVVSLQSHSLEHPDMYTPHFHDFFLIVWFRTAGGTHMVDFCDYPIVENSFFLIAPGQVHAFREGCTLDGAMLKVSSDFVHGEPGTENLFMKYRVHQMGIPYYTITDERALRNLADMLEAIRREVQLYSNEVMHKVMLQLHANAFAIQICRECVAAEKISMASLRPVHRLYIRFRRELYEHYSQFHSVREYAEVLGVSPKTLTRAVTESVGRAPGQLIDEQLVLHAKRLLASTPLRIKEVADRLGFADVANFGKFFRKNTGFLPKDYRESPEGKGSMERFREESLHKSVSIQ